MYWVLLCRRCCLIRAEISQTQSQLTCSSSKYRSCSSQLITWLHNCVTTFVIIAVTLLCHDIMCESVPDSPPPFYFSSGRGESLGTRLDFGSWHSESWHFEKLTFWELTFWELTFWDLIFWGLSIITGLDYWNGRLTLCAPKILSNKIQLPVEPAFYQEWYLPGCTDSFRLSKW